MPPVEPLPPFDTFNALEMTSNHSDWIRGVQDFTAAEEYLEELKKCLDDCNPFTTQKRKSNDWDAIADDPSVDNKAHVDLQKIRTSDLIKTDFLQEPALEQLFELEQTLA